jgi:hypothetical protein
VCTSKPAEVDNAAVASSSAGEHEIAKRGASAVRRRPSAALRHRFVESATLSSSACRQRLFQPRGRIVAHVHQALAHGGSHSGVDERFEDRVRPMHGLHGQDGRGAACQ